MFYVQNILIYMSFKGVCGGRTWSTVHFLFIIQKKKWKKYKSMTYT